MLGKSISNFLDKNGKVKDWPSKRKYKLEVLKFLYSKFRDNELYNEREIDNIIKDSSTYPDYTMLRRELINNGFLSRTNDGRKYWKVG